MKKGFIFSLDAFFAIILFALVVFLIYVFSINSFGLNQQYFFSEDLLTVFSETKISKLDLSQYPEINSLRQNGKINELDITILEQIVTFQSMEPPDVESSDKLIKDLADKIKNEGLRTTISIGEQDFYDLPPEDVANLLTRTRLAVGKR